MTAPAQNGPALEIRDLVKTFGSFVAVDHVSFQVNKGVPRIQNHCHECNSQVAINVTRVATDIARSVPIFRKVKCVGKKKSFMTKSFQ